jgi:hypothetical protein
MGLIRKNTCQGDEKKKKYVPDFESDCSAHRKILSVDRALAENAAEHQVDTFATLIR